MMAGSMLPTGSRLMPSRSSPIARMSAPPTPVIDEMTAGVMYGWIAVAERRDASLDDDDRNHRKPDAHAERRRKEERGEAVEERLEIEH